MITNLIFQSYNKRSLKKFVNLIKNLNFLNNNFIIIKSFRLNVKKKKINVLKSPHVNKNANENFVQTIYIFKIVVKSLNYYNLLYIIKKLNNLVFFDLKIYLIFLIQLKILNCKNFNINTFKLKKNLKSNFIKLLDAYGEKCLYNLLFIEV